MIKLIGITKDFRSDTLITRALDDINIEIQKGEFLSIMGPSGCGKSTLLNTLGMLDRASKGQYFFDNADINKLSHRQLADLRNKNLGFIFQSFNLIDDLSVAENIELPLLYQGMDKASRQAKVQAVLEKVDIAHRANHFPNQLSGGQQQRVAVARAVVVEPKLILADEPTGNLDSKNGQQVMELLVTLNKEGTTIVMVTHSDSDASYGDRIIRLLDGTIRNVTQLKRESKYA
jgi:putative ABC transport system ATP-binding protein